MRMETEDPVGPEPGRHDPVVDHIRDVNHRLHIRAGGVVLSSNMLSHHCVTNYIKSAQGNIWTFKIKKFFGTHFIFHLLANCKSSSLQHNVETWHKACWRDGSWHQRTAWECRRGRLWSTVSFWIAIELQNLSAVLDLARATEIDNHILNNVGKQIRYSTCMDE